MYQVTLAIYYLFALINALHIIKAFRMGTQIGRKLGTAMMMNFLMIWAYSFNLLAESRLLKSLGCSVAFILLDWMLYFYYSYVVAFIDWAKRVPIWIKIAFAAYGVIDAIFLLINPFREVALSYSERAFGDGYLLIYVPMIPFHVHTIYNFIMIMVTIALLLLKTGEVPKIFLSRYRGPIAGMALSVAIFGGYLSGMLSISLDPLPLLYVFVGLLLYYYTFNYLPKVTEKITRNVILQYLRDPIILFDYEGHLADHSSMMEKLMPDFDFKDSTMTIEKFMKTWQVSGLNGTDHEQEFDWIHEENGVIRTYQCQFSIMRDEKAKLIGKLFVFHDVTNSRRTFFELENSMLYDSVTGFFNRQSFYTQLPQWNNPEYWPVSIAVCNVDGMGALNEAYGTTYGDGVMRSVARYIRRRVGEHTFCAKIDNGDIIAVLEKTSNADAADIMESVRMEVLEFYENMPISVEYGIATKDDKEIGVEKTMQNARASMQNKKMLKEKSASSSLVDSLKQTLCESDYQTEEHVERTRQMAARLGRRLGLADAEIGKLELLAVLHDIGKVAIPQDIIKKQGKLTPEERSIIEQHTVKGYRIAASSPELGEIADGILCHHEKWDGTGYPNALAGEEIPLIARIISAVDSHDVMVNDRPYHKAMPERDAIAELRRCSGTQFDPLIIDVFTDMLEHEDLVREEAALREEGVLA